MLPWEEEKKHFARSPKERGAQGGERGYLYALAKVGDCEFIWIRKYPLFPIWEQRVLRDSFGSRDAKSETDRTWSLPYSYLYLNIDTDIDTDTLQI